MSSSDSKAADAAIRKVLDATGASEENARSIPGITQDDARAAMAYPGVSEELERLVAADRASVPQGDPAPDFCLPRLTGAEPGERVALSEHFGRRPVALVFGSYT